MDSSVLIWDRPTIRGLAERYPKLLENALLTASDYVAWHLMSHIGLACYTGRQRVAQVLVTLARTIGQETRGGVALHLTNEELANAANVMPFAVSRLITQWQRDRALLLLQECRYGTPAVAACQKFGTSKSDSNERMTESFGQVNRARSVSKPFRH